MRQLVFFAVLAVGFAANVYAETIKVSVNGLVCSFCATGIEKTFKAQPAVDKVKVDLDSKLVTIHTKEGQTLDDAACTKLLTDAGYSVTHIVREK